MKVALRHGVFVHVDVRDPDLAHRAPGDPIPHATVKKERLTPKRDFLTHLFTQQI